jgi:hypothetical protein
MSSSDQTPQPSTGASASAARLIQIIQGINEVDVSASSLEDRAAVVELIELTTDEQRSSLLLALLLDRLGTAA